MKQLVCALLSIFAITAAVPTLAQQPEADHSTPGMGMKGFDGMMGGHGMMKGHGRTMMPGMMGRDCPMMGMTRQGEAVPAHIDSRLSSLATELGITDAQKDAWTTYSAALRKSTEAMQSMHADMMKSTDAKSPVERLNAHILVMERRLDALREVKPALEHLYGTLSADQKAKADQLLTGMGCMT
jgi:hypothetical protein